MKSFNVFTQFPAGFIVLFPIMEELQMKSDV